MDTTTCHFVEDGVPSAYPPCSVGRDPCVPPRDVRCLSLRHRFALTPPSQREAGDNGLPHQCTHWLGMTGNGTSGTPSPAKRNRNRAKRDGKRPPGTRKHTVLPVSIRLKSAEKAPTCVSMRAFLQPISARIYFGKTASHRKSARFVQSQGALPQAYWMSVKAAQRRGCVKRAFCGVCFLVPGGLSRPVRIHCTALFFRRSS